MKSWQYAVGTWVVASLGVALSSTGHPYLSLPPLVLGSFGMIMLIRKRREQ